jgi:long-chain acyl-CoA synthetase
LILERAAREPSGLALDDGEHQRTWAELESRVLRAARLYRDVLGMRPDEHAALLMGNRVEFVELLLGALVAGIWITPLSRHLLGEEIAAIAADAGARVLLTDPEHRERAVAAGGAETLCAGPELEALLAKASDAPLDLAGPPGGTMPYTSGTTGRPKGVKRRRAASVAEALDAWRASGRSIGLDGAGTHLVTGPLYHAAPGLFAVYDLLSGAPLVLMPRFDERRTLALIGERDVRHTHMVPTMFVRLLRLPEEERVRFDPSPLRLVLHGAAPVSVPVKQRMLDWWGDVLVEYWGGTEGGVTTLVDAATWRERLGTVGRAVPHYEVFAVDEEGQRLPPGEVGLLYSRHRKVPRLFAYHGDPEKTDRAYLDESAFTLGDVGSVDAEGFVFLADRLSHTIISGGVNIYPAEVEKVLLEHPAVADVGVFGIPDEEWGERVHAAVEPAKGHAGGPALEEEILAFARRHLAAYKVPRALAFHEALPRNAAGKLEVRRLRDPYWQGRARRI